MFKKATKTRSHIRFGIAGPSGAGKTWTALKIARGLVGESGTIAVLDTEHGSASLYAGDVAEFDVAELTTFDPREYCKIIEGAGKAGYDALIIDSLTHAWSGKGGALELVDKAAKRSKAGNKFVAWREVTPLHNRLVETILSYPGHVICTLRSKTEYTMEENERGKKVPTKVGLAPIQRDGLEYECTVFGEMDLDHTLTISKSRCSALADEVITRPDERVGHTLLEWLSDGEFVTPVPEKQEEPAAKKAATKEVKSAPGKSMLVQLGNVLTGDELAAWCMEHAGNMRAMKDQEEKGSLWKSIVGAAGRAGVSEDQVREWVSEA